MSTSSLKRPFNTNQPRLTLNDGVLKNRTIQDDLEANGNLKLSAIFGSLFAEDKNSKLGKSLWVPEITTNLSAEITSKPANHKYGAFSLPYADKMHALFIGAETVKQCEHQGSKFYAIPTSAGTPAVRHALKVTSNTTIFPTGSWGGYKSILTDVYDASQKPVRQINYPMLDAKGQFNVEGLKESLEKTREEGDYEVTIILNFPCNPSGTNTNYHLDQKNNLSVLEIAKALKEHADKEGSAFLLFDLAYVNFSDPQTMSYLPKFLELLGEHHGKSIVCAFAMTFSKVVGDYGGNRAGALGLVVPQSEETSAVEFLDMAAFDARRTYSSPSNVGIEFAKQLVTEEKNIKAINRFITEARDVLTERQQMLLDAMSMQCSSYGFDFNGKPDSEGSLFSTINKANKSSGFKFLLAPDGFFNVIEAPTLELAQKFKENSTKNGLVMVQAASFAARVARCGLVNQAEYELAASLLFRTLKETLS